MQIRQISKELINQLYNYLRERTVLKGEKCLRNVMTLSYFFLLHPYYFHCSIKGTSKERLFLLQVIPDSDADCISQRIRILQLHRLNMRQIICHVLIKLYIPPCYVGNYN